MIIAVDLHGCLDTYPEIFKVMLQSLHRSEFVYVLSGPPLEQIQVELDELGYTQGIHYGAILSVVDWIKYKGTQMYRHKNGSWYCEDDIWWSSKAKICEEKYIDVLYDDHLRYKEHIKDNRTTFFHVQ